MSQTGEANRGSISQSISRYKKPWEWNQVHDVVRRYATARHVSIYVISDHYDSLNIDLWGRVLTHIYGEPHASHLRADLQQDITPYTIKALASSTFGLNGVAICIEHERNHIFNALLTHGPEGLRLQFLHPGGVEPDPQQTHLKGGLILI